MNVAGFNSLSAQTVAVIEGFNAATVNFMVGEGGMYFHHNNQRYYVDKVYPKHALPADITGGLLAFPNPKEHLSYRGRLHFQKNNSYYLLAFISRKEGKAFALAFGKLRG